MILLLLNFVVAMGQLWPEGAPPFARHVNIVFLILNFCLLLFLLFSRPRTG